MERSTKTVGMGFCGWLTIVFIVLKLCGKIDWSWIWVLCPIWIPIAISIGILLLILGFGIVWGLIGTKNKRW